MQQVIGNILSNAIKFTPPGKEVDLRLRREDHKLKISVKDQGETLKTFNPNEDPVVGVFQYTLNVSKDGKAPYLPLDPGGTNMNGSTRSGASGGTG